MDEYLPELIARRAARDAAEATKKKSATERVRRDVAAETRGEALVMDGSNATPESFVGDEDDD